MDVLYSPDAFGHPAVLPTLAREFGIDVGVTWRGLGGSCRRTAISTPGAAPTRHDVAASPAGAGIRDWRRARRFSLGNCHRHWAAIRKSLVDRSVTSHVAVFIGADHHAPPHDPSAIRDRIQEIEPAHQVRLSTLREYFDAATKAIEADALRLRSVTAPRTGIRRRCRRAALVVRLHLDVARRPRHPGTAEAASHCR